MKRSSASIARTLHSAASALEHGRHSTVAKKLVYLDDSDLATILAALRLFQTEYEDCDAVQIADAWPMHFNVQGNHGEVGGQDVSDELRVVPEPLGTEDIDALCERINTTKVMVLA